MLNVSNEKRKVIEREASTERYQKRMEKEIKPKAKVEEVAKIKGKKETRERIINKKILTFKKDEIRNIGENIPNNLEITYDKLKEEKVKYTELARKLKLTYLEPKIDDKNIQSSIGLIRNNLQRIINQIQEVNDLEKLNKVKGVFSELEDLTLDGTITADHAKMLKENFVKSFDTKVQNLIKNSKLSKLKMERAQIEKEKVSIIGKIFGKESLKKAKLDNIDVRKQLLMFEEKDKYQYSLEDSLSDLYEYSQHELGGKFTPKMQEFLKVVKSNVQLKQMIDGQGLKQKIEKKLSERNGGKNMLVPINNPKLSNRQKASMIQSQNSEMNRQLQNSRIRKLTKQNNFTLTEMENASSLSRFYEIVNKIKLTTSLRDSEYKQRSFAKKYIIE